MDNRVAQTPRRRPIAHEADEQIKLFCWADSMLPKYPEIALMHHIPNGGSRNAAEAANLKRQGVKAGVPDVFLPVSRGKWCGMYIEMKWGKNTTSEKQKQWITALRGQRYIVEVCYSWQQAAEFISKYLEMGKIT